MSAQTLASREVLAISIDPLTGIRNAVSDGTDGFLESVGSAFANMAADLSASIFNFAAQQTAIDLNKDYIVNNYNIVFGVAILVVTGLFMCACIAGAIRGDAHLLGRSLASTGTAIFGSFVMLTLLQMVLSAADGMSEAFGDGAPLGASLVAQLRALPQQGNFALDMVLSLLVALFSFALFLVLYIRKIAIIAVAVFIPLYLAGQPAMSTRDWMKRAMEILAALILAKPVIYAIFTLGASIAGDSTGSGMDQTLTILSGIVIMAAAVFSPFALLRVIGMADVQLMQVVGAAGRRGAASFGHGAGALLGSSSRETFRGIGGRLQSRQRSGSGVDAGRPFTGDLAPVGTGAAARAGSRRGTGVGPMTRVGAPVARAGRAGSGQPARTAARAAEHADVGSPAPRTRSATGTGNRVAAPAGTSARASQAVPRALPPAGSSPKVTSPRPPIHPTRTGGG
ncbi:hypothetical protein FsymDg_4491 [Candidatus Protofrankia datiscae]|uniref:TrbL/VirB6 plasmid conjugal transfer protein n=1 Tax=Candidatus Protofrankia datiscae TaxID=2716812 RepID=F8AX44_9ACTN|nr:hypothetical protein FsymDg_4491 [Candidatus Protofrankia datiscae]